MKKAIGYMLISVLCFAVMNLTVKFLHRLPATELVLFRSFISLVLCAYFLRKRHIPFFGNNKTFLILRGIFGLIGLTLFFYTLQNLPLGSAVTLQYLSPVFTTLFAIFILKEKVFRLQWLFILIAFSGIAIIKGFDPNISPLLFLSGIGSAVFSGLAYNCVRKLKDSDHPLVVVFYFPLISTPVMLLINIFNWQMPLGWEWPLLLLMGVLTQIAQIYLTKALQAAEVNYITSLTYLGVIFALGFDFFIFGVQYQPIVIGGILLVISGVIMNIFYKSWKTKKLKTANS